MDVSKAFQVLQEHVGTHSNNKYQNTPINIEGSLTEPKFTLLTAEKYIARYLATAGEKRAQKIDLLKACHFILFELQSRINQDEAEATKNQVKINYSEPIPFSHVGNIMTKSPFNFFFCDSPYVDEVRYGAGSYLFKLQRDGSWSLYNQLELIISGTRFDYNDVDRMANYINQLTHLSGRYLNQVVKSLHRNK